MTAGDERLSRAIAAIDAANADDPNTIVIARPAGPGGQEQSVARPKELAHAELMTAWVTRLCPDASDAPARGLAEPVGRLLYLVHLGVLLWWLLDKSPKQRATTTLVALFQQILPSTALTLRLPFVRRFIVSVDELIREALFGDIVEARSER